MDGNKKMISLHEQKFLDLDAFQVNTSDILKNVEAQIGHLVQAFKENFSRSSASNTLPNPNECMDTPLSSVQKFPILKFVKKGENELEIEKKALLNNLENGKSLVDKLKFEKGSQVMTIENVLVKIDTFSFPMDFMAWGIEGDQKNLKILKIQLPFSSQAWMDINKGELTLFVGEDKSKFNLHQPLPLTEQERTMCRNHVACFHQKGTCLNSPP